MFALPGRQGALRGQGKAHKGGAQIYRPEGPKCQNSVLRPLNSRGPTFTLRSNQIPSALFSVGPGVSEQCCSDAQESAGDPAKMRPLTLFWGGSGEAAFLTRSLVLPRLPVHGPRCRGVLLGCNRELKGAAACDAYTDYSPGQAPEKTANVVLGSQRQILVRCVCSNFA